MNWWIDLLQPLLVATVTAVAVILWRTSMTLERVTTALAAHERADEERFDAVNQRLDDLRNDMGSGGRRRR